MTCKFNKKIHKKKMGTSEKPWVQSGTTGYKGGYKHFFVPENVIFCFLCRFFSLVVSFVYVVFKKGEFVQVVKFKVLIHPINVISLLLNV